MPYATYSSTSTSSGYIPRTYAASDSSSSSTSSYPLELDIGDTSGSGTSSSSSPGSFTGSTGRPLMSYSFPFSSSDLGRSNSSHYQAKANSSTRGNAGSNP